MPKAIRTDSQFNRTTGSALPGLFSGKPGSVARQVHDGDTLDVVPNGNVAVRLLGIDTPEVSYMFPGPRPLFVTLKDERWNDLLRDPFHDQWGAFASVVPPALTSWIQSKVNGQPGTVHHEHAVAATTELRTLISADMQTLGQDLSTFGYYLSFGFEVMDVFGRFLCAINRNQPDRSLPTPRPLTYNLRLLESGRAFPYFIWPNINPWERPGSVTEAVIPPGQARQLAETDRELRTARRFVQNARVQHRGVFDAMNPLLLEPFELRFLSRRELPERYLIDLTSESRTLIHPHNYYRVPLPEDRLWIPAAYVPLFEKAGWQCERPATPAGR